MTKKDAWIIFENLRKGTQYISRTFWRFLEQNLSTTSQYIGILPNNTFSTTKPRLVGEKAI